MEPPHKPIVHIGPLGEWYPDVDPKQAKHPLLVCRGCWARFFLPAKVSEELRCPRCRVTRPVVERVRK
jgi:PHP family Zn ribbon phosphoesterase